jgi:prepilin peptidase CpaA
MSFPAFHVGVATALLLAAASADVWKRKIPNAINLALGLIGLCAQASARNWGAVVSGAATGFLTLALLWLPWRSGWLGGGDVKLAAGAGFWLSLPRLPEYLLLAALAGGVLSLLYYALSSRDARHQIRANLTSAAMSGTVPKVTLASGQGRRSVPFGVSFAASAGLILWGVHLW